MARRRPSLRRRLLTGLLPSILALACVWLWAAYAIVIHFVNVAYDRALEDSVETISRQVRVEANGFVLDMPPAARQMLRFDRVDHIYFVFVDEKQHIYLKNAQVPGPADNRPNAHGSVFYDTIIDGQSVRAVQTIVHAGKGRYLAIRVAETRQKRNMLAREVMSYMAAPQSLFLIGIILLVWFGVGRGVAPLARVRDAIARLAPQDLSRIELDKLPAELEEQVSLINALTARLAAMLAAQRRFIADASHQLRTPVTNILTQVELAQRAATFAETRSMLAKIDATSVRLVRLIGQLLTLSRVEAGVADFKNLEHFAIEEAIRDAVAWSVPSALARNIEVAVHAPDRPISFYGDRHAIEQLVANLVDNAVRYSKEGGHVTVTVFAEGEVVHINVEDDGGGIPAAYREQVLDRFNRGPRPSGQGTGLGLSIAREVALLHRGELRLRDGAPAGLRVEVQLPLDFTRSSPDSSPA